MGVRTVSVREQGLWPASGEGAAGPLGPGGARPGAKAETRHHPGGFMSQIGCLLCSFWEVTEIPPPLRQQSRLVGACAGVRSGSTASAGFPLVLPDTSDSLNLHLKNLDYADFYFQRSFPRVFQA